MRNRVGRHRRTTDCGVHPQTRSSRRSATRGSPTAPHIPAPRAPSEPRSRRPKVPRIPDGTYELAGTAKEIEDASEALGEAAGLATLRGLRLLGQSRLVQKLGQVLVSKAIPAVYEKQTAAVAKALRITGIWLCASDGVLPSCPCLRDLATDQTKTRPQERLEAHLSNVV